MRAFITIVILAAIAAFFIYAPYRTVAKIERGIVNRDGEAIAKHIDFPSLRENVKAHMNSTLAEEKESNNPLLAMGAALSGSAVNSAVDALVTPQGFITMVSSAARFAGDTGASSKAQPLARASKRYHSFNRFAVTLKNEQKEVQMRFVLQRKGLGWKVTDMDVPTEALQALLPSF